MSSFNEAILFSGDSILIKEGCEIKNTKREIFLKKAVYWLPLLLDSWD